jgi:hypothetical protein
MAITSSIETIGTTRAADYLKTMDGNRNLSRYTVNRYCRDILEGKWTINGQPIIFDSNNKLLDGQHRLHAILESGTSVKALVIRGIERKTFHTLDTGKKRTVGDVLSINKIEQHNAVAACIALVYVYESGELKPDELWGFNKPSVTEVLDYYNNNQGISNSIKLSARMGHLGTRTPFAAAHWIFSRIDPIKADDFMMKLKDGENLQMKSVIYRLREQLIRYRADRRRLSNAIVLAVLIKAWNSLEMSNPPKIFVWKQGEVFPKAT